MMKTLWKLEVERKFSNMMKTIYKKKKKKRRREKKSKICGETLKAFPLRSEQDKEI